MAHKVIFEVSCRCWIKKEKHCHVFQLFCVYRHKVIFLDEKEIIKGCIRGDVKAQRHVYDHYGPVLMGLCLRYAGNREDAEEIFHDALMKVFNSIEKFKGDSSLKTWVNRIGINTALDFLRRKRNALMVEHISENTLAVPDDNDEQDISMEAEMAMKLLHSLPVSQQIILNLYVIDEYSHKEIGQQLNISEEASRTQYSRAKKALAELVKKKLYRNEIGQ